MNRLLIGILAICPLPLYAQNVAQPDAANLKAEVRNAVGTIVADKHKTRIYCQILDLERQELDQDETNKKKKNKSKDKTESFSRKIDQLQKQVGPEFVTLDNILKHLDLTSSEGREIALMIQGLNQSCPD